MDTHKKLVEEKLISRPYMLYDANHKPKAIIKKLENLMNNV